MHYHMMFLASVASLFVLPAFGHPAPGALTTAALAKRTEAPASVTDSCKITTTSYPTTGPSAASYSSMGLTGVQTYCTCGETIAGINLATSGTSTTTYCAMGEGVPLGYTQIPSENGTPVSSQPQSTAGSGQCQDGSVVDASCFNDLDLPDYVTKWWSSNQGQCDNLPFGDCFYKVATKYSPSNCSQININSNCDQPKWDDFKVRFLFLPRGMMTCERY